MSYALRNYKGYTSDTDRVRLQQTLEFIVEEPAYTFDTPTRQELVQLIVDDLHTVASSTEEGACRLTRSDAAPALLTLKTLGKVPAGAGVMAKEDNLRKLLTVATALEDDLPDASNEALRCIANTLLLVDEARDTWTSESLDGGAAAARLLEKSTTHERTFFIARILFLATVSFHLCKFVKKLVEEPISDKGNIIDVCITHLDVLAKDVPNEEKLAKEAMTDILKFLFNVLMNYPKLVNRENEIISPATNPATAGNLEIVTEGSWHDSLNPVLAPLLNYYFSLPSPGLSVGPPLAHVIHNLILIPVSNTLRPVWFPGRSKQGTPSATGSPTVEPGEPGSPSREASTSKPGALDRALSLLSGGRRSLTRDRTPRAASPVDVGPNPARRAADLLDRFLAELLPGACDPDDAEARDRVHRLADGTLDDALSPVLVLLTRLATADAASRRTLYNRYFPAELDRSSPLEKRADTLGRCLRLLSAVYHPRSRDAAGELLYALCSSDAGILVGQVGYGNVAGLLYNKGVMAAPPRAEGTPTSTPSGQAINPITGTTYAPPSSGPEMTDEEKEEEAEKLFVLFDRLEKNGAIQPSQNPVRKAMQEAQKRK